MSDILTPLFVLDEKTIGLFLKQHQLSGTQTKVSGMAARVKRTHTDTPTHCCTPTVNLQLEEKNSYEI